MNLKFIVHDAIDLGLDLGRRQSVRTRARVQRDSLLQSIAREPFNKLYWLHTMLANETGEQLINDHYGPFCDHFCGMSFSALV